MGFQARESEYDSCKTRAWKPMLHSDAHHITKIHSLFGIDILRRPRTGGGATLATGYKLYKAFDLKRTLALPSLVVRVEHAPDCFSESTLSEWLLNEAGQPFP